MRVGGVKTIVVVLCGVLAGASSAAAQQAQPASKSDAPTQPFTVNGLALGARVPSGSAAYKAYDCGPSSLFKGFTWCHRTSTEKKSGTKINTSSSLMHSADGAIVYANQSSEPSSYTSKEVKAELQRLKDKYGAQPRILNMPHKPEFAEGVIATWGDVTLEPLDAESMKILATGKSPGKGLLLDFIGNLRRSAQVGLPVYRLAGGAGFVWSASYGKKGGGALRSAAVDASAFSPGAATATAAPAPSPAPAATTATTPAPAPVTSQAPSSAPEVSPVSPPAAAAAPKPVPAPATSQTSPRAVASPTPPATAAPQTPAPALAAAPTPARAPAAAPPSAPAPAASSALGAAQSPAPATDKANEKDANSAELNQTIEKLKAELASSATRIAQLETAKDQAERATAQAQQARADAETARAQAELAIGVDRQALEGKTRWLEILAYAAIAGLIAVLAINALLMMRRRAGEASEEDVSDVDIKPLSAPSSAAQLELLPDRLSEQLLESKPHPEPLKAEETATQYPGDLISENIFGRELERHVARINALDDETDVTAPRETQPALLKPS